VPSTHPRNFPEKVHFGAVTWGDSEVTSMAAKKSKKSSKSKKAAPRARPRRSSAPPRPRTITPYLAVGSAVEALEWYKRAFDAKEMDRQLDPSGKIMHASLKIGDSLVMLSDIFPGSDMRDPLYAGPSVSVHVFSKNIDKLWGKAVAAGAKVNMPLDNQFWGARYGRLADPFGHSWSFSYPAKMSKAEKERKLQESLKAFGAGEHPGSNAGSAPPG
jgi:uncharacterized glyoxalase superfamily protein PhnB